jgi:DNA transformation protein and related proteins
VPLSREYLEFVLGQLAGLDGVRAQRMFSGAGLYSEGWFFALVSGDTLYLRVDDHNRDDFTARGMSAFNPHALRPGARAVSLSYFEVPPEVLEEPGELIVWAQRSLAAARRAPPRRRAATSAAGPASGSGSRVRARPAKRRGRPQP